MKLLLWLCALLLTPCAGRCDGTRAAPVAPVWVKWSDARTGKTLFTSEDILSFSWKGQSVQLSVEKTLDFRAWAQGIYKELRVEDQQGVIYKAHYVSDLSSMGFGGPVYQLGNPYIGIKNGYPSGFLNKDERFSPRLEADLKQLGLLHELDPTERFSPSPIETVSQLWQSANDATKVRVEYFPATFQVGQKARAHVFFVLDAPFGKSEPTRTFDRAVLQVRLVSSDGRFRSETQVGAFSFEQLSQEPLMVARFDPWHGLEGSVLPMESGDAGVALSVLLQKQSKTGFNTVSRLDFLEVQVAFRGPQPPED